MSAVYAVIDTNVLVAAFISRNPDSAVVKVVNALFRKQIVPMHNPEIIAEYRDVLSRSKFALPEKLVSGVIDEIERSGLLAERVNSDEIFPDPDDRVFYEVALSKDDAYLVTGNAKHFPKSGIVVSPAEMLLILERQTHSSGLLNQP